MKAKLSQGVNNMRQNYFVTLFICALVLFACLEQILAQTNTRGGEDEKQEDARAEAKNSKSLENPTGYFEKNSLRLRYTSKLTFDEYVTYAMRSIALVAGFDSDLHRYDNRLDLINSFERNLTYGHDLSEMRAHVDSSESVLLRDASELTLLENERNQAKCELQLNLIYEQTLKLMANYQSYTKSRQLDLIEFLDSFGAAPREQLLMGNTIWLGAYDQCQQAEISLPRHGAASAGLSKSNDGGDENVARANEKQLTAAAAATLSPIKIRGRYCVAHLRLPTWSRAQAKVSLGSESIKLGVCLPRACNSISILRHSSRIESLIKLVRLQQVPYSSLQLTQLFCLPDESSPLRQLSNSAKLFLAFTGVWLSLVVYFSLKFEFLAAIRDGRQNEHHSKLVQVFALRYAWNQLIGSASRNQQATTGANFIEKNLRLRSGEPERSCAGQLTTTKSIIMRIHTPTGFDSGHNSPVHHSESSASSDDDERETATNSTPRTQINELEKPIKEQTVYVAANNQQQQQQQQQQSNNLNSIDGIKVISMIWLISAHTLLFFIRNITNGRQFWTILLDGRFLTIMAGIFPVDSFFTVTGILTSYLKFNKSSSDVSQSSLSSVNYWLETFVHRYLRFMPMYLLIFWYTRDVSEYIGSGPMWDYATASTSLRSICKRESVLVPLLFQANFKPIEQHCVKPAWYLANDYQYLLITPIFMLLLLLSRWLGYLVISLSVLVSLVLQFLTVYYPQLITNTSNHVNELPFEDFETLANFKPMFATYVLKDLWKLYVLPYNRIPPYLIGLLTGHLMYRCNKQRRRQMFINQQTKQQHQTTESLETSCASTESLVSSSSIVKKQQNNVENQVARREKLSLHQLEKDALTQENTKNKTNQDRDYGDEQSEEKGGGLLFIIKLLKNYLNLSLWMPVFLLIFIIYLPIISKLLDEQEGERAKIVASSIIALMRFAWSISVARLIYLCYINKTTTTTTTFVNDTSDSSGSFIINLLSSSKWKPFSKIGLSVLLIQWEVIAYVNQVQAGPPLMSITYLLASVIICIVLSYTLGALVFLLFEFPMSQIEHLFIHPNLFNFRKKATI